MTLLSDSLLFQWLPTSTLVGRFVHKYRDCFHLHPWVKLETESRWNLPDSLFIGCSKRRTGWKLATWSEVPTNCSIEKDGKFEWQRRLTWKQSVRPFSKRWTAIRPLC